MVRAVMPLEPCLGHFNMYIELMEDDSSLLRNPSASVPNEGEISISPQLLWYLVPEGMRGLTARWMA